MITWLWYCLLDFPTIKLHTPAPIPHHARKYVTPLEWDVLLHLRGGVFTKLSGILRGRFFSSPLFIYIHMNWRFVCLNGFWILIQYDFMFLLNVYQLWPLVISSASSWVLLLYPHHCKGFVFGFLWGFFVHFLTFWLQVHLVYFLPQS